MKHLDFNEFTNCLRICIVPDEFQDERIEEVKNYCLKYGFLNVMLFFNAEDYCVGHITREELAPAMATIKKAAKILKENGISVSVNPWMEMGHLDRGRKLKEGQNFTTMVDMNGYQAQIVACPYDEEWRKYYFDIVDYYLGEEDFEVLWIEDDFRLHNHTPLEFGGCFCDIHMKKYNERLNSNYTREELVEKIFAKGAPTKERQAWIDQNTETMLDISKAVGDHLRKNHKGVKVGLMSSTPHAHAIEGRDWHTLTKNLSPDGIIINRIHLPCYNEDCGKRYFQRFNCISMVVRSFLPNEVIVYPELENGTFNTFTKDSEFLRFQLESSLPLLPSGMTYDIYDFAGNGVIESFGYGEKVKGITPYMQGVMDLKLDFAKMQGVTIPVFEDTSKNRRIVNGWEDLYPNEYDLAGYVNGFGINYKFTHEKRVKNQVVILAGQNPYNYTDQDLKYLFENNFVIVDGIATEIIVNRGLKNLLGIESYILHTNDENCQAYEQAEPDFIVNGKKGYRSTCQLSVGNYLEINYNKPVKKYTSTYTAERKYFGNGIVKGENFAVIPYYMTNDLYFELYSPLRVTALYDIVKTHADKLALSDYNAMHTYLYDYNGGNAIIVVNATVNKFDKLKLTLKGVAFSEVYIVNKQTGKVEQADYTFDGSTLTINSGINYLSTQTIILK